VVVTVMMDAYAMAFVPAITVVADNAGFSDLRQEHGETKQQRGETGIDFCILQHG
jgi:hypothetical protein